MHYYLMHTESGLLEGAMRVVFALIICCAAGYAQAKSIYAYKSVHSDGTVSYSDTRPAAGESVERVTISPSSAAIEQQGAQRVQQMDTAAKTLEKQRSGAAQAKSDYQKRVNEARQELTDAERNLVTVEQSKKSASPERIKAARKRISLARQKLREVQSAGP
jgi:hypothetical protein